MHLAICSLIMSTKQGASLADGVYTLSGMRDIISV